MVGTNGLGSFVCHHLFRSSVAKSTPLIADVGRFGVPSAVKLRGWTAVNDYDVKLWSATVGFTPTQAVDQFNSAETLRWSDRNKPPFVREITRF